jgi:hypothetical protein
MKKVITLLSVVVLLTSCSTPYQTTNYEKTYTFKRGGVRYKITDTYTRKVETDTLTIKKK